MKRLKYSVGLLDIVNEVHHIGEYLNIHFERNVRRECEDHEGS